MSDPGGRRHTLAAFGVTAFAFGAAFAGIKAGLASASPARALVWVAVVSAALGGVLLRRLSPSMGACR